MKRYAILIALLLAFSLAFSSCTITPDNDSNLENNDVGKDEGHKHSFGDWVVKVSPSCEGKGMRERFCPCGENESEEIAPNGHNFVNGLCIVCGKGYSVGLDFQSNYDGTCYVEGRGECTDEFIVIPTKSPDGEIVIAIGNDAFHIDSRITGLSVPSTVTTIGSSSFYGCELLETVILPNTITEIGGKAFALCAFTSFDFGGSNITIIEEGTFDLCKNLKSIDLPDSVTTIDRLSFRGCSSLERIEISDKIKTIGELAFSECISLVEIAVDENNENYKSIDGSLYIKDGKVLIQYALGRPDTSFVVPNTVEIIASESFLRCPNLISVEIGKNVTKIWEATFFMCDRMTDIYYAGSEEDWLNINIGNYNDVFDSATIHFNYQKTE